MIDYNKAFTNLNNNVTKEDAFSIEFLGMFENESNILGRSVLSFTPPNLSLESEVHSHRNNRYKDYTKILVGPISMTLRADENGLVATVILAQIFRQINKHMDLLGSSNDINRNYKFDIRHRVYNSSREIVEEYVYKNCFIMEYDIGTNDYASGEDRMITVTIEADTIDVTNFDRYSEMVGSKFIL